MKNIKPIHEVKFKINSRGQFAPTINKTILSEIMQEHHLKENDTIYLYDEKSHTLINEILEQNIELGENIRTLEDGINNDTANHEKELITITNERDKLKESNTELNNKYKALAIDYESAKVQNNELTTKYTAIKHDYDMMKATLEKLSTENEALTKDTIDYKKQTQELEQAIKNAENTASDVDKQITNAKEHLIHADKTIHELNTTIKTKDTIIKERTNQLNEMKTDYKNLQNDYNKQVHDHAGQIAFLSGGINYIYDKLNSLNPFIRWLGGLNLVIERIKSIKELQQDNNSTVINTERVLFAPEE